MRCSYRWYPRIGDIRVEHQGITLMEMVILQRSQPGAGTISIGVNCITSEERLRRRSRWSRTHRIRLLLLLQQLLQRMGSRQFRWLNFKVLWLLVSLMGQGLRGRMFLFQDLQLSGCDGSVSFPGWFTLPIPHHCCQPTHSFFSNDKRGLMLLFRLSSCAVIFHLLSFWLFTQQA